jgi:hypothetical protein
MHFGTKSYLKSNRNHTAKQTQIKKNIELLDHWVNSWVSHGLNNLIKKILFYFLF